MFSFVTEIHKVDPDFYTFKILIGFTIFVFSRIGEEEGFIEFWGEIFLDFAIHCFVSFYFKLFTKFIMAQGEEEKYPDERIAKAMVVEKESLMHSIAVSPEDIKRRKKILWEMFAVDFDNITKENRKVVEQKMKWSCSCFENNGEEAFENLDYHKTFELCHCKGRNEEKCKDKKFLFKISGYYLGYRIVIMSNAVYIQGFNASTPISTGDGAVGSGCLRVAVASGGSNANINLVSVGGTAVGAGTGGNAAALRVVQASDYTPSCNISQVGGNNTQTGTGVVGSGVQRVTLATDVNVPGNIKQINGTTISLGQTTMSASLPVTLASNQSTLPVSIAATQAVNVSQVGGNSISVGSGTNGTGVQRVSIATDCLVSSALQDLYAVRKFQNTSGITMNNFYTTLAGSSGGAIDRYIPEGWDLVNNPTVGYLNGASTFSMSSASNSDTGLVFIRGYNATGVYKSETITLTGRTPVTSANSYVQLCEVAKYDGGAFSGIVYAYDTGATVTTGVPNRAITCLPASSYGKSRINAIYIPVNYTCYFNTLRISAIGNTTTPEVTLNGYYVGGNTGSIGNSNKTTYREWPVSNTFFYNYLGGLAIHADNGSDVLVWFTANFSGADTNGRVLIEANDSTFSRLKSAYKSKFQSTFHDENDSDYFDGDSDEDERKDRAGGPIERNPYSSRKRYPGNKKQRKLVEPLGIRPIEMNTYQHKLHRTAVRERDKKKIKKRVDWFNNGYKY
ncbi:hypothetical protein RFI_39869 [Reticulomyxa filosa]|uniref:Uncharacterized protein n=1 Tax=Reticulomyxa filosa TaxID=46433 RepID=X6L952_RETFI|nr:hypothetical protein RFI_39869 [Reticulomyxa filosa]|eukprot:ETN97661.1 hypothetical protein RFI_39869 [Reticulomyxa filosa]